MDSWKGLLSQAIRTSRKPALVGIGQELRGDDAAGVLVVRTLQSIAESAPQDPAVTEAARPCAPFLFEAGSLPEASAGPLRRFGPDRVIFIDAADMGEAPGSVRWIDPARLEGTPLATHTFPMGGFSAYLESELGCRVAILGIQPECIDFDAPVSDCVRKAMDEIAAVIVGVLEKDRI